MARLAGFVYDDAGAPVSGATVTVFARNTTTPAIDTDTTDADGHWELLEIAEGRYDVQVERGSEKERRKYDVEVQVEGVEAKRLALRGSDNNFTVVFASTPTATRTITIPDATDTKTLPMNRLVTALLSAVELPPEVRAGRLLRQIRAPRGGRSPSAADGGYGRVRSGAAGPCP
jgi:hypothetical protein